MYIQSISIMLNHFISVTILMVSISRCRSLCASAFDLSRALTIVCKAFFEGHQIHEAGGTAEHEPLHWPNTLRPRQIMPTKDGLYKCCFHFDWDYCRLQAWKYQRSICYLCVMSCYLQCHILNWANWQVLLPLQGTQRCRPLGPSTSAGSISRAKQGKSGKSGDDSNDF